MFFSRLATVGAFASLAQAQLNIPYVQPHYDVWGHMDTQLRNNMVSTPYTAVLMAPGWVPESCFNGWYMENIDGKDIDVYTVTFNDCPEPFIVCRHRNTQASTEMIFSSLALMNGRMRQWAGNFLAIPTVMPQYSAWQSGPTIVVQDTYWASPGLMVHEMVHAMDLLKLGSGLQGGWDYWSNSQVWMDRLPQDGHVATDYARTNYIESFAEIGRIKKYDLVVPGGLAQLQQDQNQIRNQLTLFNVLYPELIQPVCNGKVPSSQLLPVPILKRRGVVAQPGPKPNITVSEVPVIEIPAEVYKMKPVTEEAFDVTF